MKKDIQDQTKHTPGPWHTAGLAVYAANSYNAPFHGRLRDFSNPVAQVCGDPMTEDAEIEQCRRGDGTVGPSWRNPGASEAEANACLIASSPNLLSDLSDLVEIASKFLPYDHAALVNARATIDKAKGLA